MASPTSLQVVADEHSLSASPPFARASGGFPMVGLFPTPLAGPLRLSRGPIRIKEKATIGEYRVNWPVTLGWGEVEAVCQIESQRAERRSLAACYSPLLLAGLAAHIGFVV
jgi:hypothetical protein